MLSLVTPDQWIIGIWLVGLLLAIVFLLGAVVGYHWCKKDHGIR